MAPPARANPGAAAIEVDPRAEALIDARAVRRLVQLELADVKVPPLAGDDEARLFVRVLSAGDGGLRIELWERGMAYGARSVARVTGSAQLLARRVALAAAELARELSERRDDEAKAREQERRQELELARQARERTLDGPQALRTGIVGTWGHEHVLVGPSLAAELDVFRALRLDVAASLSAGVLHRSAAAETLGVAIGPARRFALSPSWDVDLGVWAEALLVELPDARSVDDIPGERQSWTARAEGRLRLEPRLSRSLRLAVGVGGGMLLRAMPFVLEDGGGRCIQGPFASAEISLVLTPFAAKR